MDDLERRQTEMLFRVNNFGIENNSAINAFAKALEAFTTIQTAVGQLEELGVPRSSAAETKLSQTARRAMMRNELYSDMSLIAITARVVARNNPGFVSKFRLPQGNRNDMTWLETARAFAADLVPVKQLFLDYGLPADFVEDLTADTNDFEDAISEQDEANRDSIGANAEIDDILGDALKAKRTLDVIIPNIFRGNPGKLAEWTSASHVEKSPKTATQPTPPTP